VTVRCTGSRWPAGVAGVHLARPTGYTWPLQGSSVQTVTSHPASFGPRTPIRS